MSLLGNISDYFALDIGTTAIRIVQLKGAGSNRSLVRYGSIPISEKVARSDSVSHKTQLAEAIRKLVNESKVTAKDVVVGIPSDKMFATVVDFPKLDSKELNKTIEYQADQYIPTQIDKSKVDWAVLGDSPTDKEKMEVLLASTDKKYVEERMELIESVGLNVIAMEPDAFALARSMVAQTDTSPVMVLDMGANATDLVIAYNGAPRLVRSIPVGGNSLLKVAQQNLNIDEQQAMQFVYKFGLMQDKLEGQVYKALSGVVDNLITEVTKSVKFFDTRYNTKLSKVTVTGRASILPEFPVYLVNKTNLPVEIGNAWQNVNYPKNMYNDLMAIANQYSVAVGLAEREG